MWETIWILSIRPWAIALCVGAVGALILGLVYQVTRQRSA